MLTYRKRNDRFRAIFESAGDRTFGILESRLFWRWLEKGGKVGFGPLLVSVESETSVQNKGWGKKRSTRNLLSFLQVVAPKMIL